jgi:hypothetical protein
VGEQRGRWSIKGANVRATTQERRAAYEARTVSFYETLRPGTDLVAASALDVGLTSADYSLLSVKQLASILHGRCLGHLPGSELEACLLKLETQRRAWLVTRILEPATAAKYRTRVPTAAGGAASSSVAQPTPAAPRPPFAPIFAERRGGNVPTAAAPPKKWPTSDTTNFAHVVLPALLVKVLAAVEAAKGASGYRLLLVARCPASNPGRGRAHAGLRHAQPHVRC